MTIWRWADGFDSVPREAQVTLGEGDTPLVRSQRLGSGSGLNQLYFKLESCNPSLKYSWFSPLYFKLESCNPSGSYKDRFAFCAVSPMVAAGQRRCVATTSGNTGSALAAYCAAAGIQCNIAVLEDAPLGKLQQMLSYGANIYRVRRFGMDSTVTMQVFETLQKLGQRPDTALQVSAFKYSPLGMSGVRTIGFELAEQAPRPIDHVFTQAGGGGMTVAVAEAFQYLVEQGSVQQCPRVECVQPQGNNTIAGPLREGAEQGQDVQCTTKISGLQVANVIDGHETIRACRATRGTGHLVSDELIWQTQLRLAREEGIFCEPAGAAATAGALQAAAEGLVHPDAVVVALVTGVGFKDPASVATMVQDRECPVIEANELEARAGG